MEWITDPHAWVALATLTALEIVLGIDNIIFITILTGKLPEHQRPRGQRIGLAGAMLTRIALLFSLTLIMRLTAPWFSIFAIEISGRDIILIVGGLFLLVKATLEIHDKLEGSEEKQTARKLRSSFLSVIIQIMLLDIVFSLDSVITAIGLANQLAVMVTAIIIAVLFMMFSVGTISRFVDQHPTIKILALSFLLLIGFTLIGEGFDMHIPKGYMYFAMAFSVFVEVLNLRVRKSTLKPVKLR
ncbi:TerC family protein [candidate division CSSED10-310 bacterium]|uniref:TerC family protein n=1 Tax=candidate division CSSED10-310 bacterium TaxID=2855610 RepID=A0ABV6YRS8_UNCC1